ncbi:MAG: hypothetical protein AAF604_07925 [Acidobacteriota bacterium]
MRAIFRIVLALPMIWIVPAHGDSKELDSTVAKAEAQFTQSTVEEERQEAAYLLIRSGHGRAEHVDLLLQAAQRAITRETPFPFTVDEGGAIQGRSPSQAFLTWCESRDEDRDALANAYVYEDPADVLFLARSESAEGLTTLRAGLESDNPWIVMVSAEGLARQGDSPDAIAAKARQALPEFRPLIARELLRFPQESHQRTAAELIGDAAAVDAFRRALAREDGTDSSEEAP